MANKHIKDGWHHWPLGKCQLKPPMQREYHFLNALSPFTKAESTKLLWMAGRRRKDFLTEPEKRVWKLRYWHSKQRTTMKFPHPLMEFHVIHSCFTGSWISSLLSWSHLFLDQKESWKSWLDPRVAPESCLSDVSSEACTQQSVLYIKYGQCAVSGTGIYHKAPRLSFFTEDISYSIRVNKNLCDITETSGLQLIHCSNQ